MDTAVTAMPDEATLFDDPVLHGTVQPNEESRPDKGAAFEDGKDPQALRTIGEVAKALGIRPHVLRYWEEQFPALQPIKRSGNRRYYRPEDIVLIGEIDRLVHREGYTLRGAAKAIEDKSSSEVRSISSHPKNDAQEIPHKNFLRKLADIREGLASALERA